MTLSEPRAVRWLMLALLFVPLAIATWAVVVTVAQDEALPYTQVAVVREHELPAHTWQYGSEFTQGTATALSRPPGGYPAEQPLPKAVQEIRWPDSASDFHEVTIATREPFRFARDL